mmetsp:Transcript_17886/g.49551  ORF Transcript_17886/g.49551 Transcript_17886/m.49551 type:complete len:106 (+) Transcript_17886:205-522(+)
MFVPITYVTAPFPILLFGRVIDLFCVFQLRFEQICFQPDSGFDGKMISYWSFFTTGWIITVSFGIPAILAHTGVIAPGNCGFSLAASVAFYGTGLLAEFIGSKSE